MIQKGYAVTKAFFTLKGKTFYFFESATELESAVLQKSLPQLSININI